MLFIADLCTTQHRFTLEPAAPAPHPHHRQAHRAVTEHSVVLDCNHSFASEYRFESHYAQPSACEHCSHTGKQQQAFTLRASSNSQSDTCDGSHCNFRIEAYLYRGASVVSC